MERSGKKNRIVGRAILAGALALALAGLVALSAQARGPEWGGREPSPDRRAAWMAERLGLSAEQKTRTQEILTQGFAKRNEIREEGRKKMESLRKETEERISGVLTPEQMEKLRRLREKRGDRGPQPGDREGGFPGGPPPKHD
jgi:Spy/CpxP family protein refolding chaperone